MDVIGLLGVFFGAGGLLIGLYSQYKQKKFEKRLEQKEDLREIAEVLAEFVDHLEKLHLSLSAPLERRGLQKELVGFGKEIISYNHASEEAPVIEVSVYTWEGENRKEIVSTNEVLEEYRPSGNLAFISLTIEGGQDYYDEEKFCQLDKVLDGLGRLKFIIAGLDKEQKELMEQLQPGLISEVETLLNTILTNIFEEALETESRIECDPDDFEDVNELVLYLFTNCIVYDELTADLEELADVIDEVEEVRKSALQTSYS
ncbi:hypothetical protein NGM10_04990 [Halorussus salilacus]|uniref:hypothetical protein n=1 Tax=Halorussus salilacus TaxID=2953750 RepID=UPI00209F0DC7|nr:hypothetical protein [Halorussus salilacus]USZ69095.1 hypothetical protein NGM10_04990 [Halorussus salilacus]